MPKFSTVQAYSDSNSNVQTVSYQQATGGASDGKGERVKTEKVVNAYGSTAGANSGEFHVYRQARAREMGRMETLRIEKEKRESDLEFQQLVMDNKRQDEERTAKRRKKRQRQKEAKKRKQNLEKAGIALDHDDDDDDDDEFAMAPPPPKADAPEFVNDGSFLERMKQQLAAAAQENKLDDSKEKEEATTTEEAPTKSTSEK